MAERNNSFANLDAPDEDLGKMFPPKTRTEKKSNRLNRAMIDEIAKANEFSSRSAGKEAKEQVPSMRRRNITGRNQQINIKTTAEAIAELYKIADQKRATLGEVFEEGLKALKKTGYYENY